MNDVIKTYSVKSESVNREFGRFYVKKDAEIYSVYNKSGESLGRFNSELTALNVAENAAYKRKEILNYKLNGMPTSDLSKIMEAHEFLEKNACCMVGGFFIINGQVTDKAYYLAFEQDVRLLYPSFDAALADIITIHKAKDFNVIIS